MIELFIHHSQAEINSVRALLEDRSSESLEKLADQTIEAFDLRALWQSPVKHLLLSSELESFPCL